MIKNPMPQGLRDEDIFPAVIVVIQHDQTPPVACIRNAIRRTAVAECAHLIDEEFGRIRLKTTGGLVESVGHHEIGPAIVVGIEGLRAPAPARFLGPTRIGHVGEAAVAQIAIQSVIGEKTLDVR